MEFNFGNSRPRATQQVLQFNRIVPSAVERPVPVSDIYNETHLITTFMISNYSTAPASVFLSASQGMDASIEIMQGATPVFTTFQEGRQLYELQILIKKIASQTAEDLIQVPVIVWNLQEWWMLTGDDDERVEVAVTAFPLPYL